MTRSQRFTDRYLPLPLLQRYLLPVLPYPLEESVRTPEVEDINLPVEGMLFALQNVTSRNLALYERYEDSMLALVAQLSEGNEADDMPIRGSFWRCHATDVSLNGPVVAIQRNDRLLAAIARRDADTLNVCCFAPLDRDALELIISITRIRHRHEHTLERGRGTRAKGSSQTRADLTDSAGAGHSYRSNWVHPDGLGVKLDGTPVDTFYTQRSLKPLPPAYLAAQLDIFCRATGQHEDLPEPEAPAPVTVATPLMSWHGKQFDLPQLSLRVRGCLMGGAIGEVIATPLEDQDRATLFGHFRERPQLQANYPDGGQFGSMTQLSLLTAEAVISAATRGSDQGTDRTQTSVAARWQSWLDHQVTPGHDAAAHSGWLYAFPQLRARRDPPASLIDPEKVDAPSSGAPDYHRFAMYCMAPVALVGVRQRGSSTVNRTIRNALDVSALNNNSGEPPTTYAPACFAALILGVTEGATLDQMQAPIEKWLEAVAPDSKTLKVVKRAFAEEDGVSALSRIEVSDCDGLLEFVLSCALCSGSYEAGIKLAITNVAPGHRRIVALLMGQLMGALKGFGGIPVLWRSRIELDEAINRLGDDLASAYTWEVGPYAKDEGFSEAILKDYPPG